MEKILVVEDDKDINDLVVEILKKVDMNPLVH